jgi:Met-zincin/Domain of unknown function (DUF5117)/Domain of unknown function (DUF5118)
MKPFLRVALGLAALALGWWMCSPALSEGPHDSAAAGASSDKKFEDFDKLVKGAKEYEGLFKLYQKDENLYAEIRQDQLERPLLCPIAVARGGGLGGSTLNFEEQWVLVFKRVGDKIHLIRRNVHFKAKAGSPLATAVETTYNDSVLLALKIQALNLQKNAVVINLNDIFMSDFAQLGLGTFDANRSTWHKVKAFPKNIEIEVAATFSGGSNSGFSMFGDDSVIDARGNTVVVHYGLVELPNDGYQPRLADPRVGYFLTAQKDFSSDNPDTSFVRYVNRWRLERADGSTWKEGGKLVPPKKKIVFWIEKSVPDEYRAAVREGILEWNKAFAKVGFRDAIEVRQQENEDFDPEDISYSTLRWITTDQGFAMGPSRANPLTGEILDADIIFDASMVRFYKEEAALLSSGKPSSLLESVSPIEMVQKGQDVIAHPLLQRGSPLSWNERTAPGAKPAADAEAARVQKRLLAIRQGMCSCASHRKYEIGLAAMALAAQMKPGEKVPDDLVNQAIKETVMHEVGHTLGLRHNFKASTFLKNDQLHNTEITRKQGLVGSVMDYNPVNLAPKGVKQGDYFTTTIGPYDYWAIEYGYKPLSGGTEGEAADLKKIASAGAEPGHDYGTDEDMMTADPLIHVWDLGNDPMQFGKERMLLAQELLKDLDQRVVENGEGYQRTRLAFSMLTAQYGNAAFLVAAFVGGEHVHRDFKGDPNGRDPFVPVTAAKQREALKFLQENVLTDKPFHFSPQLLRRLAADRWMHWGNEQQLFSGVEYPVYGRVLAIQRVALRNLLDPGTLTRIQDNALKYDKEDSPLTVAEVFRTLTDSIWTDLGAAPSKTNASALVIRRNLQREHLKDLTNLVLGQSGSSFFFGSRSATPPDAKSLARMHLRDVQKKIDGALKEKGASLDDTCRAHLEECQERITKVLGASMQVNEP